MPYPNAQKMDDWVDSKSKPLHSTDIWIHNIYINYACPIILVTNTINIEHYDLRFDIVIQSCDGSNQK